MTDFLLKPLADDEMTNLEHLIREYPREYKNLVKYFNKEARAYRNQQPTYYGIDGVWFADDTYILATNWYYQKLSLHDMDALLEKI